MEDYRKRDGEGLKKLREMWQEKDMEVNKGRWGERRRAFPSLFH